MQELGNDEEIDQRNLFYTIQREYNFDDQSPQPANTLGQRFLTGSTYSSSRQSPSTITPLSDTPTYNPIPTSFHDSSLSEYTQYNRHQPLNVIPSDENTAPQMHRKPESFPPPTSSKIKDIFKLDSKRQSHISAIDLANANSKLFNPIIESVSPASIPLKLMFSATGFDVVGALVKLATRKNPKVMYMFNRLNWVP
jgi:hypothetical protein